MQQTEATAVPQLVKSFTLLKRFMQPLCLAVFAKSCCVLQGLGTFFLLLYSGVYV